MLCWNENPEIITIIRENIEKLELKNITLKKECRVVDYPLFNITK